MQSAQFIRSSAGSQRPLILAGFVGAIAGTSLPFKGPRGELSLPGTPRAAAEHG